MLQKIRNRKGFTLVELMIVVAIIGILAAIAIPNFLQFRLKAKTSEAKSNLGAIRSTEVAYFAEWDNWVGNQTAFPDSTRANSPNKIAWSGGSKFDVIGFRPEGNVFYSYVLSDTDFPAMLTMEAVGDLDDSGDISSFRINDSTPEVTHAGANF